MSVEAAPVLIAPSAPTLKKYGLSLAEWEAIAESQGRCCYVCKQVPKSGRLHIDHDHVKKWKSLPPETRKTAVRGLLCFRCNTTYCGRSITIERSQNVTRYLERFASGEVSVLISSATPTTGVS
jgi:hypothetical protein